MLNILFLSLLDFASLNERNIYTDLLREFIKHDHKIFVISPVEYRKRKKTHLIEGENHRILKLQIGNVQKTNVIEKGMSTVLIEPQFIAGIRKYFNDVKFDLVLYATPPITFCKVIEYVKKRDGARSYLMLKDIFPQNAVDIGMMSKTGIRAILYRYFRRKEKNLYRISDRIGCMSQANVDYVLAHNPEVRYRHELAVKKNGKGIVEVCPNSIEPVDMSISDEERRRLRDKYRISQDKIVFVYGGNLGRPQGIDFMLKCLHSQRKNDRVFFLIVGSGTEYRRIERYMEKYEPPNVALHQWLPKDEYDKIVAACDVGMIFLDHRFTIPNFPSRLLSYMSAKLPVLAVTDTTTDIGKVIVENGFGWWCESDGAEKFDEIVHHMVYEEIVEMGAIGMEYLNDHYAAEKSYWIVIGQKNFLAECRAVRSGKINNLEF